MSQNYPSLLPTGRMHDQRAAPKLQVLISRRDEVVIDIPNVQLKHGRQRSRD
jgi:hypothetical protein